MKKRVLDGCYVRVQSDSPADFEKALRIFNKQVVESRTLKILSERFKYPAIGDRKRAKARKAASRAMARVAKK